MKEGMVSAAPVTMELAVAAGGEDTAMTEPQSEIRNTAPDGRDLQVVDEREFVHQATAWTVGELRRAIADLPDDMPLQVKIADSPGGSTFDVQVVTDAEVGAAIRRPDQEPVLGTTLSLECEFPTGRYLRPTVAR